MIEKTTAFSQGDSKVIEHVIDRESVMINHMILPHGEALPEHRANSKVYMTVLRGKVTLTLNEQPPHMYPAGNIIEIPMQTQMNVSNQDEDVLELLVIKAPGPKAYA